MKKLLLITLLIALGAAAFGQVAAYVEPPVNQYKGLGLHFGNLSASGFSYRTFKESHGYQFTVGGITLGSKDIDSYHYGEYNGATPITVTQDGRRTNLNIGINYLQSLASNRTGRFYVFGGASYLYSRIRQYDVDYRLLYNSSGYDDEYVRMDSPERPKWGNKHQYFVGAGLGFDFNLGQNFHWAIELPLTMDQDQEFMMYIPQTGLYYYFQ